MLMPDGDKFIGGPLDVLCILQHEGRFHPAFFEEAPFPGPVQEVAATPVVRLKSKMHHTSGFGTLAEAVQEIEAGSLSKITLPPENIVREPVQWDGSLGLVRVVRNWRNGAPLTPADLA